jgi:hypothetical protein
MDNKAGGDKTRLVIRAIILRALPAQACVFQSLGEDEHRQVEARA